MDTNFSDGFVFLPCLPSVSLARLIQQLSAFIYPQTRFPLSSPLFFFLSVHTLTCFSFSLSLAHLVRSLLCFEPLSLSLTHNSSSPSHNDHLSSRSPSSSPTQQTVTMRMRGHEDCGRKPSDWANASEGRDDSPNSIQSGAHQPVRRGPPWSQSPGPSVSPHPNTLPAPHASPGPPLLAPQPRSGVQNVVPGSEGIRSPPWSTPYCEISVSPPL